VGDGRHVLLSTSQGFQVLDTHTPDLTSTVFAADAPGHVVHHADRTVLFADGTGETTVFDTAALLDSAGELPPTSTFRSPSAHHGGSVVLEDGTLVTTIGDVSSRSGATALEPHDDHFHEIARSEECPDIHG